MPVKPTDFTEYQGVRCFFPIKVVKAEAYDLVDTDEPRWEVQDADGLVIESIDRRKDAIILRDELAAEEDRQAREVRLANERREASATGRGR